MKNFKRTILPVALLTALSCIGAAVVCTQKSTPLTAKADVPNAQLISPESYQQYLPLNAPTAVAVTSGCTAIADENKIYLYEGELLEETAGTYRVYTHESPVSQLAFDEEGNLYFLSKLKLYTISVADLSSPATATKLNDVVCRDFVIYGNTLYYYAIADNVINRYSLTDHAELEELALPTPLKDGTPLTVALNLLYYIGETEGVPTLYTVNVTTGESNVIATFPKALKSLTIANHLLCAVTESGDFYAYNYNELCNQKNAETVPPITLEEKGFKTVYTYNDEVFAIRDNAVHNYSVSDAAFTDFEITSTSAAAHRLNGANDVFLAEDKLFISDDGNDRISVYNTQTNVFETAIPTELPAPYLTSYKDTLLAASKDEAVLYNLSAAHYGETLLTVSTEEIDGSIIGAACIYDRYYLLTDSDYTYTFTENNGVWNYTEAQRAPFNGMKATAFTADAYGSLYVGYDSGELYRFTEKEFTSSETTGIKLLNGLNSVDKLAVDCEENLYALSNGTLTKYTQNDEGRYELNATFTPNYGLVKDDNPLLTSFTFGVKNTDTYFLYENNYLVKSDELQIPMVNPIPVGNAVECLFGADNQGFTLVTVSENTILTEFDVNALQGATDFPYLSFERCDAPVTALKIGEEERYSIIAVADGATAYKTYLVETVACETVATEEYRTAYENETTGYLVNAVSLYKFPYLSELFTAAELSRGAQVTLLSEIRLPDRTYYEISYVDENGATQTGFIPTAYVNAFDGTNPLSQTTTYGDAEDDFDAVGRLAYILLGLGAIGILLDFLLLKKPKETDEN